MVDLSLGLDIAAIFGILVYMSLLIAESFGTLGKLGSGERAFVNMDISPPGEIAFNRNNK